MTDITITLGERGERYGKFITQAVASQSLKNVVRSLIGADKWNKELSADQQEALEMICHKIARIINGDPNYADSWHDIAGYAQLVADRLNGIER